MNLKMIKIEMQKGYLVKIHLNDGNNIQYSLREKTDTIRFMELREEKIFFNGYLKDEETIHWSRYTELTLTEILKSVKHSRDIQPSD